MNRAQRRGKHKQRNTTQSAAPAIDVQHSLHEAFADYHAGRRPAAAHNCRMVLEQAPDQVDALHLLGVITNEDGNPREAAGLVSRAITLDPAQPSFHNSMGVILRSHGKLEEAATCYRTALKLAPGDSGAMNNLANTLRDQGRLAEAADQLSRALEINPADAATHYNMALALEDLGKLEDAVVSYRRALEYAPDDSNTIGNLGLVYLLLGNPAEALVYFNRLLALDPQAADTHNNIGNAHRLAGDLDQATLSYRRAIACQPQYADAHFNLGLIQQEAGDLEEAIDCYQHALEHNALMAAAHVGLAEIYEKQNRLDRLPHHLTAAMQLEPDNVSANRLAAVMLRREGKYKEALQKLSRLALPATEDQITESIHFELGRLYDLDHQSDRAMHHFAEGNRLQVRNTDSRVADKERYLAWIRQLRDYFSQNGGAFHPLASCSPGLNTPMFLIGFPRSGTTLLDQILDSHPQIQVMEEKPALEKILQDVARRLEGYPRALAGLSNDDREQLRLQYFSIVEQSLVRRPDTLLIDKFPLNICHVGLINRIFPEARLILALRHPYDVCLSCFMQSFVLNDAMANFSTIGDTAVLYDEVMRLWQQSVRIFAPNFHSLHYESLVDDFRGEVSSLLEFLGVGWDDAVLNYTTHAKTRGSINTPSYQQVTEPVYRRAKYRWERYHSYLEPVKGLLHQHVEYFGY
jgi:tetratricopeptide (TPR) repeat protein